MKQEKRALHFWDEAPKIGTGFRIVTASIGRKYVYLKTNYRNQRITRKVWDQMLRRKRNQQSGVLYDMKKTTRKTAVKPRELDLGDKIAKSKLAGYGIESEEEADVQPDAFERATGVERRPLWELSDDDPDRRPITRHRVATDKKNATHAKELREQSQDPLTIPSFLRRQRQLEHPAYSGRLVEMASKFHRANGSVEIPSEQLDEIVNLLHRTLGDTMEKAGLLWKTAAAKKTKKMLTALVKQAVWTPDGDHHYTINITDSEKE